MLPAEQLEFRGVTVRKFDFDAALMRRPAETVTLPGQRATETILESARTRNVTEIFMGKTNQPRWRRWFTGGVVDEASQSRAGKSKSISVRAK